MKTCLIGILVLFALDLTTRAARAGEPAQEPLAPGSSASDSTGVEAKVWYGAPIVITDLAALGALVGGTVLADRGSDAGWGLMVLGTGAYLLGGPIVHVTQRGAGRGFASLGLRAGAAVGGALTGALIGGAIGSKEKCGGNDNCGLSGFALGGAVGLFGGGLIAMLVDSAGLAYKSSTPMTPALALSPIYHPSTHHAGLALQGIW